MRWYGDPKTTVWIQLLNWKLILVIRSRVRSNERRLACVRSLEQKTATLKFLYKNHEYGNPIVFRSKQKHYMLGYIPLTPL